MDERIKKLAHNLVNNSCKVQKGEHVLINTIGEDTLELSRALIKEIYLLGAYPHIELKNTSITREMYLGCSDAQLTAMQDYELYKMKKMDAFIGIRSTDNTYEYVDVPDEKVELMDKFMDPVLRQRVDHSKWVVLRYPNGSMAQAAKMSKEAFEDYYFNVCNLDYGKMGKAMQHLKTLMEHTDSVQIKGKDTDLTFSIKGIPIIPCAGECNIPDGEGYTAPVKNSINGVLSYNTPNQYQGFVYEKIVLTFKDGKIIDAVANDTKKINAVFNTDEGARYVGEFAIGVNPYITKPMLDTLFDEKITGSFHFTPGASYEDAFNGNKSAIHWDLVCMQTPEYGGGEIRFDGKLIRKDGRFVIPELECLNPENLID